MHLSILFVYLIFLIKNEPATSEKAYNVEIRSFTPSQNNGIFDPKSLRVTRKGKNKYVLAGDFSLFINLGEDSMLVYEITKKVDILNSYSTVLKSSTNICKFCSTNTNFYPRFWTYTNFPDPKTCPFPKGNYTVKDYTFDDLSLPPTVPSGIYILKSFYTKYDENIFGYTIEFLVTRS